MGSGIHGMEPTTKGGYEHTCTVVLSKAHTIFNAQGSADVLRSSMRSRCIRLRVYGAISGYFVCTRDRQSKLFSIHCPFGSSHLIRAQTCHGVARHLLSHIQQGQLEADTFKHWSRCSMLRPSSLTAVQRRIMTVMGTRITVWNCGK